MRIHRIDVLRNGNCCREFVASVPIDPEKPHCEMAHVPWFGDVWCGFTSGDRRPGWQERHFNGPSPDYRYYSTEAEAAFDVKTCWGEYGAHMQVLGAIRPAPKPALEDALTGWWVDMLHGPTVLVPVPSITEALAEFSRWMRGSIDSMEAVGGHKSFVTTLQCGASTYRLDVYKCRVA